MRKSKYPWQGTLSKPRLDEPTKGYRIRYFNNYRAICGMCGYREWTNEVHTASAKDVLRSHGWHFVEARWMGWVCDTCFEKRRTEREANHGQ